MGRDEEQHEVMEGSIRLGTQPGQVRHEKEVLRRASVDRLEDYQIDVGLEISCVPPRENSLSGQGVVEVSRAVYKILRYA